jgi:predicted DsbA family dithiol-disulfide isomerase
LHPETPDSGRTLQDLFAGQPVDIPAMLAHLRQVARDLDLPFGDRTMTFNSRLAQELGKWAEEQNKGDAFHRATFRAYFQHGENIAQKTVLLRIGAAVGLDPAAAQTVLEQRTHRQAVDRDWERSRRMGITAVPTFVLGDRRLVGAQPYDALKRMVLDAGVGRRS